MVSLPSSVKIGAQVYQVLCDEEDWEKTEHTEKNSNLWGCTDNRNLKIHLRPNVPATQQADTLLHEVLHAMFAYQNLPLIFENFRKDSDLEEMLASILTPLWHQTIVDNPHLVAYVQDPTQAVLPAVIPKRVAKK